MKKIIIGVMFLFAVPTLAIGGGAAPYTEDALQQVISAMGKVPKAQPSPDISRAEFHKRFVEYYSKVFELAGYSFSATIDQIVDDMKNNPEAIPADHRSVYNNLYILLHVMMYECTESEIDCLQPFPNKTKESILWFVENSEFSKHENTAHHGVR